MKNAVIPYLSYPRNVFQRYKSAEIHNKQSFKPPRRQLFPLISSYSDDRELLMDILKYSTEVEVIPDNPLNLIHATVIVKLVVA